MVNWDNETRVIIDGITIWSCDIWSGAGTLSNSNPSLYSCANGLTFTVPLDASSKVEIQTFEGSGESNLEVKIIKSITNSLTSIPVALRTCRVKGNEWIYFQDETNHELIAAINPNGDDLGEVTMTSYLDLPSVMQACNTPHPLYHTAYMGRSWVMTSTEYPNGDDFNSNVSVRLPYTITELADLNNTAETVTIENLFDGGVARPAIKENLMLTKVTGLFEDGVANSNDCGSIILGIPSSGSGVPILGITNTEYVEFNIN